MSQHEMLTKLKEHVQRLNNLLADPQPGLFTWCGFVGKEWKAIVDLWEGKPE